MEHQTLVTRIKERKGPSMKSALLGSILGMCALAVGCGDGGGSESRSGTAPGSLGAAATVASPSSTSPKPAVGSTARTELSQVLTKLSGFQLSAFGYAEEGVTVCRRVDALARDLGGGQASNNEELLHRAAVDLQGVCASFARALSQVDMVERERIRQQVLSERDAGVVGGSGEIATDQANRQWRAMIEPAHAKMTEACDLYKRAGGDCSIMALAPIGD